MVTGQPASAVREAALWFAAPAGFFKCRAQSSVGPREERGSRVHTATEPFGSALCRHAFPSGGHIQLTPSSLPVYRAAPEGDLGHSAQLNRRSSRLLRSVADRGVATATSPRPCWLEDQSPESRTTSAPQGSWRVPGWAGPSLRASSGRPLADPRTTARLGQLNRPAPKAQPGLESHPRGRFSSLNHAS